MKFVMNGGLILGTLDGANIEIREEGGDDTMFIFGAKEHEVDHIRERVSSIQLVKEAGCGSFESMTDIPVLHFM